MKIQDLIGEIAHGYSCRRLEVDPLPSGVCFIHVTIGRRHFVLEYHPKEGTGVSENVANTPAFVGHDTVFDSLEKAIHHFKSLLNDAEHTEADYAPAAFALREDNLPWNKRT
ncbi:MAG TPA: hypothetical protein VGI88_05840 [Verrucomicrobiae bacterium]